VEAKGVSGVNQLSVGGGHACAVTGTGKVYCWGLNDSGQVGNGTLTNVATPVSVLTGMKQVSCGARHTCALKSNGDLYCWGASANGCLGIDPVPPDTTKPVHVTGLGGYDEVAAGGQHTCGRIGTATYCWGNDYTGQVHGSFGPVTTPIEVDIDGTPPPAQHVVVGSAASAAIGSDDEVDVWGLMFHGDGEGETGYAPAKLSIGPVLDLSLGMDSTNCAIKTNHQLVCWGGDGYGQAGDGDPVADVKTPAAIAFEE
jgi:alpha-tubulin suppressor-like RCC1 family protein